MLTQPLRPTVKLPTFNTLRLIVRELSVEDAASYEKHFVDYRVIRNLSAVVPWPYPQNGVQEYISNVVVPIQGRDRWIWGIAEKDTPDEVIGCIDLWREGKPENRGFWLAHQHWGKGYMTEAVEPVMQYAFEELGFEKLIFTNAVGNTRSARIKEKTGARFICREPAQYVDPTFTEREVYELTKDEWYRLKETR